MRRVREVTCETLSSVLMSVATKGTRGATSISNCTTLVQRITSLRGTGRGPRNVRVETRFNHSWGRCNNCNGNDKQSRAVRFSRANRDDSLYVSFNAR